MGCALGGAHDDDEDRNPAGYVDTGSGSRMHPAASLTDLFPVNRKMPQRPANPNSEFFFKNCSRGGARWMYSRTSYDCDYPF